MDVAEKCQPRSEVKSPLLAFQAVAYSLCRVLGSHSGAKKCRVVC
jgi:hypothetical protein